MKIKSLFLFCAFAVTAFTANAQVAQRQTAASLSSQYVAAQQYFASHQQPAKLIPFQVIATLAPIAADLYSVGLPAGATNQICGTIQQMSAGTYGQDGRVQFPLPMSAFANRLGGNSIAQVHEATYAVAHEQANALLNAASLFQKNNSCAKNNLCCKQGGTTDVCQSKDLKNCKIDSYGWCTNSDNCPN